MISKGYHFLIYFAFLMMGSSLSAACTTTSKDIIGENFQYTYNCKNSHQAVQYQIIRHLTHRTDFEFFTFDPRGWNLLCSKLNFDDKAIEASCIQTGMKKPKLYTGRNLIVELKLNVNYLEFKSIIEKINEYAFAYPSSPESYETIGCAIFLKNDVLTVYAPHSGIETLGKCFLNYELFMSS
jgi:hypothetical protein|tara:strand:+ start:218 stop:763 length:546 start_codon:yes stop_codon:yes gene_type:complete